MTPVERGITFKELAEFACFDFVRVVLEDRKASLLSLLPELPRDRHGYVAIRMLLEDMLVNGVVTVYKPERMVVDSSTIRLIISDDGKTPAPPNPAYQQVIRGLPTADLTVDDLLYKKRHELPGRLYGTSDVEQMINFGVQREQDALACLSPIDEDLAWFKGLIQEIGIGS